MNFKKYICFTLLSMTLSLNSCLDFEDLNDDNISTVNIIEEGDMLNFLYTIYAELSSQQLYGGYQMYFEAFTDNANIISNSNTATTLFEISTTEQNGLNSIIEGVWGRNWFGIRQANLLIDNIDANTNPRVTKDQKPVLKDEARVLRVLFYLNLTTLFGDIPLNNEFIFFNSDETKLTNPASTRQEVFAYMVSELQDVIASQNLGDDSGTLSRISLSMAKALLAKVSMFGYSFVDDENVKSDYLDLVLTYAKEVVDTPNKYQLYDNFADNFSIDNEDDLQGEAIFTVEFLNGAKTEIYSSFRLFTNNTLMRGSNIGELYNPMEDLFLEFEPQDTRRAASIFTEGEQFIFEITGIDEDQVAVFQSSTKGSDALGRDVYSPKKYVVNNQDLIGSRDYTYMRLAEVMLFYIEADIEKNNVTSFDALSQTSKDYWVAILKRANVISDIDTEAIAFNYLQNLNYIDEDPLEGNQVRSTLRRERRLEFALEGNYRYFDLLRWGILEEMLLKDNDQIDNGIVVSTRLRGNSFQDFNYLWPIPDEDIGGTGVLEQNPGY